MFFPSLLFLTVIVFSVLKLGNLLSYLLSLERASLYFFLIFVFFVQGSHSDSLIFLFYLAVMVVESVLGLILFVMFVRY
jgi:NADH:ubiquinone oxidoreductase subunit K